MDIDLVFVRGVKIDIVVLCCPKFTWFLCMDRQRFLQGRDRLTRCFVWVVEIDFVFVSGNYI